MRKHHRSKKDVIMRWLGVLIFSVVVGSGIAWMGIYGILKETENKFYIVGENNERR